MIRLISYAHWATFLLLFVAVIFPNSTFQTLLYWIAGIFFVLDYICSKRYKRWQWDRNKVFYLLLILYYICIPVWQSFSPVHNQAYQYALRDYFPFLYIGVMGLLGISRRIKIKHVAVVMLCTSFAVPFVSLRLQGVLYVVISLIFAAFLFLRLKKRLWKIILLIVSVCIIANIGVATGRQYKSYKAEYRACPTLWEDTWFVIHYSPMLGYGNSVACEKMIQVSTIDDRLQRRYIPFVREHYQGNLYKIQAHNTFLQAWVDFGVIGFLLILAILFYPLAMLPRRNFWYIFATVIVFAVFGCVESLFLPLLFGLSITVLTPQAKPKQQNSFQIKQS